ncbi:hypothetical protein CSA37_09445 [Candidatus Fermentibacteria bacterium]|nr:MAG: hypothetical protein CSA37_09445 [Candidatus Fermentibacteria bacterium]
MSNSFTQTVPVITGTAQKATCLSRQLEKLGIQAAAVRPPIVPENTSKLRFSIKLEHSQQDFVKVSELAGKRL